MAKETEKLSELNDIYDSILGKGNPLTAEAVGTEGVDDAESLGDSPRKPAQQRDAAYLPEDYNDDNADNDGVDPRDESTQRSDGEDAVDDEDQDADDEGKESPEGRQDNSGEDDDGEVIDPRLVAAGRRAKLDDDTIIELAETKPEILEALAKTQELAVHALSKPSDDSGEDADAALAQEAAQKKTNPAKSSLLDDINALLGEGDDEDGYDADLSPKAKKVIKALAGKVEQLSQRLETHDEGLTQIQQQSQRDAVRKIDEFFDRSSKDLPQLGNASSKQLSPQQAEARLYAYRIARGAQHAFGGNLSDGEALAIGVNALKGSLTESQLKAKLVTDLNRNKKRFTSRYHGQRRPDSERSSMTAEQRARKAIDDVLDDPKYQRRL